MVRSRGASARTSALNDTHARTHSVSSSLGGHIHTANEDSERSHSRHNRARGYYTCAGTYNGTSGRLENSANMRTHTHTQWRERESAHGMVNEWYGRGAGECVLLCKELSRSVP